MSKKEKLPIIRGIYLIVSPTNKHYVGKAKDCYDRQRAYHTPYCKRQPAIYNSLKKYGFKEHSWQIIHILDEDEDNIMLNYYEKYYIRKYRNMGYTMLNLTEGGDGAELTPEVRARMRITNKYFQYELMNIETGEIELSSNIEKFCEDIGYDSPSNLHNTLYHLDLYGRNCVKDCPYKILSKIHLRDNKINDETQIYIKNERIRRANLKYERERNHIKYNINNIYNPRSVYIFGIMNILTKKIDYYDNLTEFCEKHHIGCRKAFGSTMYGYYKNGRKISYIKNFKVVSKHLLKFNIDKDTKLQQEIERERILRMCNRELNGITDKFSKEYNNKHRMNNEQFRFEILHIPSNKIIPSNNLTQFCLKYCDNSQSTWLSNSLYGYSHKGHIVESYKGYKLISKHYINPNKDDTKLQQEIDSERLRRSLLRNSTK